MLEWWSIVETVEKIDGHLRLYAFWAIAVTGLLLIGLWFLSKKIAAFKESGQPINDPKPEKLKKAAKEIRKELLDTQQERDILTQRLRTFESESGKLRDELGKMRKKVRNTADSTGSFQRNERENRYDDGSIPVTGDAVDELEPVKPAALLSETQRKTLMDLIEPGPKGNIDIVAVLGNDHAERMAVELNDILTQGGWTTNGVSRSAFSKPPQGILLTVHSRDTTPTYAMFLQKILAATGLSTSGSINKSVQEWSMTLVVGEIKS
ncbi:MAG: hypothetical protein HKM93_19945 [Desulfobacteraceae bacterium]|nr:hypothetical protein [Desulfobacteraceae bacterium]